MPILLPPDYISARARRATPGMRDAVDAAHGSVRAEHAAPSSSTATSSSPTSLMSSAKAREAFALEEEPGKTKDRYGRTPVRPVVPDGRAATDRSRALRFVTVNMFETVFDEVTWDIHGSKPFTDIVQMSKEVAPNFDAAPSARRWKTCSDRGLLSNTMVVAVGEFGRRPRR